MLSEATNHIHVLGCRTVVGNECVLTGPTILGAVVALVTLLSWDMAKPAISIMRICLPNSPKHESIIPSCASTRDCSFVHQSRTCSQSESEKWLKNKPDGL